jgi:hypothetical protein
MKTRCPPHIVTKSLWVIFLMAFGAPRLSPPRMRAQDGCGLDQVTWSGTIRIELQMHVQENTSDPFNGTSTRKWDKFIVTEYQVKGLPHQTEMTWRGSDVRVRVRGNDNDYGRTEDTRGGYHAVRNSQDTHDGSGSTTVYVMLILRGQGGRDSGHCWLEMGPIGERDDGGRLPERIPWPGTSHNWGVDGTQPYDITTELHDDLQPNEICGRRFLVQRMRAC